MAKKKKNSLGEHAKTILVFTLSMVFFLAIFLALGQWNSNNATSLHALATSGAEAPGLNPPPAASPAESPALAPPSPAMPEPGHESPAELQPAAATEPEPDALTEAVDEPGAAPVPAPVVRAVPVPVPERPVARSDRAPLPVPRPAGKVRRLVIVIDDVGHNIPQLSNFLSIPVPLTFAVLPSLQYTARTRDMIVAAGAGLILHQPMEALGQVDEGPAMVHAAMDSTAIRRQFRTNLDSLPGLGGANNHMGSKGTQEPEVLGPLMQELALRNLFFLDSRTSGDSVARRMAAQSGVFFLERDIFLDNESNEAAIRKALQQGLAVADHKGYAIMIGHVWSDELARVLLEEYRPLLDQGYTFDTLAGLVLGLKGGDKSGSAP